MNKLKKQFSDLRKNTPKHIQWLLLAAAFVVVLILLTLLMTRRDTEELTTVEDVAIQLNIEPDTIDWTNVTVGETKTATIKLSASAPVKIMDVRLSENATGISEPQQTCTPLTIDTQIVCQIVLTYRPMTAADMHAAAVYIDWRGANEPDSMKQTARINLALGAEKIQLPEPEPVPVAEPEPVATPEPEPIAEPEPIKTPDATPAYKQEIKRDLESIAPSAPLTFNDTASATPSAPVEDTEPEYVRPSEACSDFAMPGYNLSGVQSGWIRPSGGAYYFHPFSDKECKNPTGVYNPDNGIITDINNPAQKIGTDAEHIGYTTIQNGTLPQLSNPATTKTVAYHFADGL